MKRLIGLFCLLVMGLSGMSGLSMAHGTVSKKPLSPLQLSEVLQAVNTHFPQIRIARLQKVQAQGDLIRTMGQFDPAFSTETRHLPVGGYISNYIDSKFDVPTLYNGLKVFGGYRNGSGDWPVYYQNYLTNSGGEYRGGLSFPLLRDRRIDKDRAAMLTRSQRVRMSEQEIAATKIRVYQEAIQAYWQWVQMGLQYETFKALLKLAEIRQAAIERQADEGALPKLTIIENKQLIMQRKQLVNQSHMLFKQAAVSLSLYYRDISGNPFIPMDTQLPRLRDIRALTHEISQSDAYIALHQHPAMNKIKYYAKAVEYEKSLAQNDLKPYLDTMAFTAKQYGRNGYPLLLPQNLFIGLNFKFPIYQREAKGRLIMATSELKQVRNELRFLNERLKNTLTNLFINKQALIKQLHFVKQELDFAEKVSRGETKRFYAGGSTLFLVNQREQIVTQVSLNLIEAEININKTNSLIEYYSSPMSVNHHTAQAKTRNAYPSFSNQEQELQWIMEGQLPANSYGHSGAIYNDLSR